MNQDPRFAGLWPRFLALAVDVLVFCAVFFPVTRLVDGLPAFNILGVVMILTSPQRARFGDRAAGARVVRAR